MYMYMYMQIYMHMWIYVYVWINIHICVYTCIYIHMNFMYVCIHIYMYYMRVCTARSGEDDTRNGESLGNAYRNPECRGDFSQLVQIQKIKFFGISWYPIELRFSLDLNSAVSRVTNSNWDFSLTWIYSWLKSSHYSGFRFAFRWPFRVSSSRERAVTHQKKIKKNHLE